MAQIETIPISPLFFLEGQGLQGSKLMHKVKASKAEIYLLLWDYLTD